MHWTAVSLNPCPGTFFSSTRGDTAVDMLWMTVTYQRLVQATRDRSCYFLQFYSVFLCQQFKCDIRHFKYNSIKGWTERRAYSQNHTVKEYFSKSKIRVVLDFCCIQPIKMYWWFTCTFSDIPLQNKHLKIKWMFCIIISLDYTN